MNIDANASATTANPIAIITRTVVCCWMSARSFVTLDRDPDRGRQAAGGSLAGPRNFGANFITLGAFDEKAARSIADSSHACDQRPKLLINSFARTAS